MRDDEIDDLELPPEDPVTALLDQLDSDEDFGAPAEPPAPVRSRREIDDLVDRILDEELKRLNEWKRKG